MCSKARSQIVILKPNGQGVAGSAERVVAFGWVSIPTLRKVLVNLTEVFVGWQWHRQRGDLRVMDSPPRNKASVEATGLPVK